MNILIVDDEISIVESLQGIIVDEGYQALCATSGEEALQVIEQEQVDLVLMDVWMPGIDGIETLKRIKETTPHLPVIMISGHGTIDTAVQATKMGAYDFIEKPPGYDKIVLAIKNALHLSQVEKENMILRQKMEGQARPDRLIARDHGGQGVDRQGGAHQRLGADPRRAWHRQGAGGPGDSPPVRALP